MINFEPAHSNRIQDFVQTWTLLPYGRSPPDAVEFAYNNESVYLAQPILSQFTPGGSGLGTFDANQTTSIGLTNTPNNTLALLANGNSPDNGGIGEVLRYASPVTHLPSLSDIIIPLGIPSGASGSIARSCLTPKLICEAAYRALPQSQFADSPIQGTVIEPVVHVCLPPTRFPSGLVCCLWHASAGVAF